MHVYNICNILHALNPLSYSIPPHTYIKRVTRNLMAFNPQTTKIAIAFGHIYYHSMHMKIAHCAVHTLIAHKYHIYIHIFKYI